MKLTYTSIKTTFPLLERLYYQAKDRISSATPEAIPGRHHVSEVFTWRPVLKLQHHWFFFFFIFQTVLRLTRIKELLFILQKQKNVKLEYFICTTLLFPSCQLPTRIFMASRNKAIP